MTAEQDYILVEIEKLRQKLIELTEKQLRDVELKAEKFKFRA